MHPHIHTLIKPEAKPVSLWEKNEEEECHRLIWSFKGLFIFLEF